MSKLSFIEDKFITSYTPAELFKKVNTWLRFNRCVVLEEKAPTYIRAIYRGNILGIDGEPNIDVGRELTGIDFPQTVESLNDPFAKKIEVNIGEYGQSSKIKVTVKQTDPSYEDRGFAYWGMMFNKLKNELGFERVGSTMNLEGILRGRIRAIERTYVGLMGSALILSTLLFGAKVDMYATFAFVFFAPVTIFMGSEYRQIREQLRTQENAREIR